ncbi:MAG: hydroxyphenylacetyl-CoA thioesterase PaaI [Saprospiraceae bacterium]|nr:hydroxyphenylacetyl-CoA thioesterase PaaI [Saprospiraceae bacterium]
MEAKLSAQEIVDKMYCNDPFSLWLGIERIDEKPGYSKLKMTVRKEMLNGFHIAHGGITFSLADSALAFASNSHGHHAVSIECSINHLLPVKENDILIAEASETSRKRTHGVYLIEVKNQKNELVALFRGMVYIKDSLWK